MSFYTDPKTPAHVRKVLNDIKALAGQFADQGEIDNLQEQINDILELIENITAGTVTAVTGVAVTAGQVAYIDGAGLIQLAQANSLATSTVAGIVLESEGAGEDAQLVVSGVAEIAGATLTPGVIYYLSPTVAGELTDTAPTSYGDSVIIVGVATDATHIALIPWQKVYL